MDPSSSDNVSQKTSLLDDNSGSPETENGHGDRDSSSILVEDSDQGATTDTVLATQGAYGSCSPVQDDAIEVAESQSLLENTDLTEDEEDGSGQPAAGQWRSMAKSKTNVDAEKERSPTPLSDERMIVEEPDVPPVLANDTDDPDVEDDESRSGLEERRPSIVQVEEVPETSDEVVSSDIPDPIISEPDDDTMGDDDDSVNVGDQSGQALVTEDISEDEELQDTVGGLVDFPSTCRSNMISNAKLERQLQGQRASESVWDTQGDEDKDADDESKSDKNDHPGQKTEEEATSNLTPSRRSSRSAKKSSKSAEAEEQSDVTEESDAAVAVDEKERRKSRSRPKKTTPAKPPQPVEQKTEEKSTKKSKKAKRGRPKAVPPAADADIQQKKQVAGEVSDDIYDFGASSTEPVPAKPLKHIHMVKKSFGEMSFTKPKDERPKFTSIAARSPETIQLKAKGKADTQILDSFASLQESEKARPIYQVTTNQFITVKKLSPHSRAVIKKADFYVSPKVVETGQLSPATRHQFSPAKNTFSSGELADISSFESKSSKSTSRPSLLTSHYASTVSLVSTTGTKKRSSTSTSRPSYTGSMSLFSEVDNGDTDDNASADEHTETIPKKTPKSTKKTPAAAKRHRSPVAIHDDDEAFGPSISPKRKSARRPPSPSPIGAEMKRRQELELKLPETPEEQLEADFPSSSSGSLMPGARVLARWRDKNFYPANVVFYYGLGRYKVQFTEDKNIRTMPAPELVALTELKSESILMVTADMDDGDYELQPVIIRSAPECESEAWFDGLFEVENTVTEKTEKVSWRKFVIDKDQTMNYMKSIVNSAAEGIEASNISGVSERKERRTRSTLPTPAVAAPEVTSSSSTMSSATPKSASRKRTPASSAPRKRKSAGTPSTLKSAKKAKPDSRAAESSAGEVSTPATSSSKKSKPMAKVLPRPSARPIDEPALSDEEQSADGNAANQIFAGLNFVLTSANRRQPSTDEEEKPQVLFNKKQVRSFIEERGGRVLDDFNNVPDRYVCFLVADTHYRTHKYLSALARAIPCVSHLWIHNSCDQNELLDFKNYMLPAGVSLENVQLIEWHEECPSLLKNLSVFVHTENRPQSTAALDFEQIWSPLVQCMDAKLVKAVPDRNRFDYLLTDASCSQKVLEKAKSKGAAVVSSEWLIQAIITGKLPLPDAHQKYAYDFMDTV